MKLLSIITFILFQFHNSYSQTLEGKWEGSFSNSYTYTEAPILLYFTLSKDSIYEIYSCSLIPDHPNHNTNVICKVLYKLSGSDSLYLEETQVIKPTNIKPPCFQKMFLKIFRTKKTTVLEGTWESKIDACNDYGTIKFKKYN